jgi:hypothetical protein
VNEIHYYNQGSDESLVDMRRYDDGERVLVEKHISDGEFSLDLVKNRGAGSDDFKHRQVSTLQI